MLVLIVASGCSPIRSRSIDAQQIYGTPALANDGAQIQRGQPVKVLDTVGWLLGIPSKILLWDRRADNHNIGTETESAIASYLYDNELDSVRVRINQYRPGEDWKRLVKNKSVAAPWRYSLGALSVLGETVIPGRLFGGDHYNPYTNTVHIYSDIPSVALHEGAHAKDFARRKWKGTYAAAYLLPVVPLYHESVASSDVVAYLEGQGDTEQLAEAHRILYPAYGTYVGSAGGYALPGYADPIYFSSVLVGHAWGRLEARRIRDRAAEMVEESEFAARSPEPNQDERADSLVFNPSYAGLQNPPLPSPSVSEQVVPVSTEPRNRYTTEAGPGLPRFSAATPQATLSSYSAQEQ